MRYVLPLLLLAACANPCSSDQAIQEFAHDEARKHFPKPERVEFDVDTMIVNDYGHTVVRGRVKYDNALGNTVNWPKYWASVNCKDGAVLEFIEVDHGGPNWHR